MRECPNCGLSLKGAPRALQQTGTFRALSSRRKMLTQKHYALPFKLGDKVFERFTTRDLLGQGPMGVVYQVADQEGALWALKVIHKRWREGLDPASFEAELMGLNDAGYEQLCLTQEVLLSDEHVAIKTPILSGLTLRKLMSLRKSAQRSFQLDEVSQLLSGIHGALAPLHQQGIAHGGVKPENIFVSAADDGQSESQQLTLSDVRLSVALGLQGYARAQSASGHGHSIAPELAEGSLSPSSDVYSVGSMLYEAFTQQSLQGGKRLVSELLGITGIEPLDELINKALADDPAQRMSDIDALLSEFAEVSVQLKSLEGSPFSTEGTDPSGQSPANAQLTTGTNAIPISDPLLGGAPALATPLSSGDELEGLTLPLSSQVKTPQLSAQASPPSLPLPTEAAHPPALPPRKQQETDEVISSADSAELLIDISPKHESPALISGASRPAVNPSATPLVLNPSARGPWLLNSTLGFALSALVVIGAAASAVFYLLREEPNLAQNGAQIAELSSPPQALELKDPSPVSLNGAVAKADTEAKARAEAEAKAQAEAEAKAQAEAEAKARAEAEAKARAEAEAKARAEAEAQLKAQRLTASQSQAKAERAAQAKAEREAKTKEKREARERARAERAERAAQAKAEREAKAQAKREERARARAERAEKAAQAKAEREAKAQAKRDARAAKRAASAKLKTNTGETESSKAVPSKASVQESAGAISCPPGMLVKTTKRFPKRSVRGGKITGKAAVAMAKEGHAYCIDAYEYPGRGQVPKVNVNFAGAQALCSQVNKRLCTDREWRRACGSGFPYGKSFNGGKCNTEDAEGEERKIAAAGSFKRCRRGGVYDMSGNVSEWTSDKTVRGGYYASADEDAACSGGGRRSPSSKRSYIGFRCCADFK